jgi:hypothetical protein
MKAPVSKDCFVRIIDRLDAVRQRDGEFSEHLTEYLQHYTVVCSHDELIKDVIGFIESLFGTCGLVRYYLYDLDAGRVRKELYFSDAGELYDHLVSLI